MAQTFKVFDPTTGQYVEKEIEGILAQKGFDSIVLDVEKLVYISSAGLRVLLSMQKVMNNQGTMVIKNVCENVMDIFEVTGFSDILNIEE